MGFSYDEIEDVKLAVAEACTNSVDHAYIDNEGEIEISCSIFSDRLQIEVIDHGHSFDLRECGRANGSTERGADHEYDSRTRIRHLPDENFDGSSGY